MYIDTITINKCEFVIEFVDKKDERMVMNDIEYDGLCFRNGLILVKKYEKDWVIKNTLLHELTHAFYDDFDYKKERDLSETFVESVAYIVADYFDLDTSLCSFNYIASWVDGDTKIILELGDKIQKCANNFIKNLEKHYNDGNLQIAI